MALEYALVKPFGELPGLPGWLSGREPACQCRRRAWRPTVHGVTKSWTRLSDRTTATGTHRVRGLIHLREFAMASQRRHLQILLQC